MTVSIVGVKYAIGSKMVRAIIIPEAGDGAEDQHILDLQANPPPGMAIATVPMASVSDFRLPTLIAAIAAQGGPQLLPQERCALVDNAGHIVDNVLADTSIVSTFGGHQVIRNPNGAIPGDIWDGTNFQRTYSIVNALTGLVTSVVTLPVPQAPTLLKTQFVVLNNPALIVGSAVAVPSWQPLA